MEKYTVGKAHPKDKDAGITPKCSGSKSESVMEIYSDFFYKSESIFGRT